MRQWCCDGEINSVQKLYNFTTHLLGRKYTNHNISETAGSVVSRSQNTNTIDVSGLYS
jgi:hypothetical protein